MISLRKDDIRGRVLRAIALNRTPGLHFPGNFIELSFDRVASGDTRVSCEPGPHCIDAHGGPDIGSLAVLADFALGTAVRAELHPATRLATVSMTLELGAAPRAGIVSAASRCHGFVGEGDGRSGRSRVVIEDPGGEVGYGSGAGAATRADTAPGATAQAWRPRAGAARGTRSRA